MFLTSKKMDNIFTDYQLGVDASEFNALCYIFVENFKS
jgi:hypothetical protein